MAKDKNTDVEIVTDSQNTVTFEKYPHSVGVNLIKVYKNHFGNKTNDLLGFGITGVNGDKVLVVGKSTEADLVDLLHKFQDTYSDFQWQLVH